MNKSPHQNVLLNLPTDAAARKDIPLTTGCLDYFPMALAAVAAVSKRGNDQHNPGEPLHWARGKSTDQADTIVRHLLQRGTLDSDGTRHSAKMAWRALALLQEELEAEAGFKPDGSLEPAEAFLQRQPEPETELTAEEIVDSAVFKHMIATAGQRMQRELAALDKRCTCAQAKHFPSLNCPVHGIGPIIAAYEATHGPGTAKKSPVIRETVRNWP